MTAIALIDRMALAGNLSLVRKLAPNSQVMAVIKANGYGHSIVETCQSLDAEAFAVASTAEALELRSAGVDRPVCVLSSFVEPEDIRLAREYRIDLVVHAQRQLEMIQSDGGTSPLGVWVKLNTGMNRLGFNDIDLGQLERNLRASHGVRIIGVMSHLACADDLLESMTSEQIDRFEQLLAGSRIPRSLANSAALIAWPQTRLEWVRPGIMLYGISPFPENCTDLSVQEICNKLIPAMTLKASLIGLQYVKAGETVGYGRSWIALKDSLIGVVGIGYGDGYPRHARQGTPILVNGTRCPLVGRVSMDMITVDLTHADMINTGDDVVLWGRGLPVEEVALCADTIPYTLVTGLTPRVRREFSERALH